MNLTFSKFRLNMLQAVTYLGGEGHCAMPLP